MEKIWHKKKKTRILLIIIANVMVISMMLGVMSIMSYAELFDDLITGKLTQSYEDSYDFDTELMNSAYQVMSGIDSEQMFETDGKIDEDKLVDIQVYNNSETISGQNESGLSYRLGDLLNWYQKVCSRDRRMSLCRRYKHGFSRIRRQRRRRSEGSDRL